MEKLIAQLQAQIFDDSMLKPGEAVGSIIGLWEALAACLVPVIGEIGFRSLLDRSLHVTSSNFPWLAMDLESWDHSNRFSSLRESFNSQPPAEAIRGGVALLTTFVETLVKLIDMPLATNILRSAWGDQILQR